MLPGKTLLLWGSIIGVLFVLAAISAYYSQYLTTQVAVPNEPADQPASASKAQQAAVDPNTILVRFKNNDASAAREIFNQYSKGAVRGETTTATASPFPVIPTSSTSSLSATTSPSPFLTQQYAVTSPAAIAELTAAVPALASIQTDITAFAPVFRAPATTADSSAIDHWFKITVNNATSAAPIPVSDQFAQEPTTAPDAIFDPAHSYSKNESDALTRLATIFTALQQESDLEAVELNSVAYTQMIPNDPYYRSRGSWGQRYDDLWGMKKIEAASAWDITEGEGVTVAVIDTGVDYDHEDIDDNIWTNPGETGLDSQGNDKRSNNLDDDGNGYLDDWRGWDFANNDNDPMDGHGHGTHVAGTIAAEGNNRVGVIGVAPRAKVMAVKGMGDEGSGYSSDLAEAVRYSSDMGAMVNNNSWGGYGNSAVLKDAFQYAYDKGVISVAAAGNSQSLAANYFPVNLDTTIGVAAVKHGGRFPWFSNFGEAVDIAAPGVDILSLLASNSKYANKDWTSDPNVGEIPIVGEKYIRLSGTSMASPHVAGTVALLLANNSNQTQSDITKKVRISSTGNPYDNGQRDEYEYQDAYNEFYYDIRKYGQGILNTVEALRNENIYPEPVILNPTVKNSGRDKNKLSIEFSLSDSLVSNLDISVGQGLRPETWNSDDITILDNKSAAWDVSSLNESGQFYTIKITGTNQSGKQLTVYAVTEPAAYSSWLTGFSGSGYRKVFAIGNMDADQEKEIVVADIGDYHHAPLQVYNHDGSLAKGWPVRIENETFALFHWPIVTDLNGDGLGEIVFTTQKSKNECDSCNKTYNLHVFTGNAEEMPGWPQEFEALEVAPPTIADTNNDGIKEIMVGTTKNGLQISRWSSDGSVLPSWNISDHLEEGQTTTFSTITTVDTDQDEKLETFVSVNTLGYNRNFAVVAFSSTGDLFSGWPINFGSGGQRLSMPVIGNVIGDNKPEVVIMDERSKIFTASLDGQPLGRGWYIAGDAYSSIYQISGGATTLSDIYGDDHLEIIVGSQAYQGDGTPVPNWNVSPSDYVRYVVSPSLIDINGDKELEYVHTKLDEVYNSPKPPFYIYAQEKDNSDSMNWPIKVTAPVQNEILADDIDGDGDIEIIVLENDRPDIIYGTGILRIYDTPGLASAGTWPLVNKDAQNSRGYNIPPQCSNGIDDDDDGLIDFPKDTGCANVKDDDEAIVALQRVEINRRCNVIVEYSKEFDTCAHLVSADTFTPLHYENLFCQPSVTAIEPISKFTADLKPGLLVKLCHGNSYNNCSQAVQVTGMARCVLQR